MTDVGTKEIEQSSQPIVCDVEEMCITSGVFSYYIILYNNYKCTV